MNEKPIIIFDTDMDTDCDDAGALAVLAAFARAGRADLIGVVANAAVDEAAPCCEALCRHYGISPAIGAVYPADYPAAYFARYSAHRSGIADARYYNRPLAASVGKKATDYPRADALYRRLLAAAPDKSVTLVCVGLQTAFFALLNSRPDAVSEKSGRELVREKVLRIVTMGSARFPETREPNFNFAMDAFATHGVLETSPVPLHISREGAAVITGGHLTDALPKTHPLRFIYEAYMEGEHKGRASWDLIAALFALMPDSPLFCVTPHEGLSAAYNPDENRAFWQPGDRPDCEIGLAVPPEEMAAILNRVMLGDLGVLENLP